MELLLKALLWEDVVDREFRGTITAKLPKMGLEKEFAFCIQPCQQPPLMVFWREGEIFVKVIDILTDEMFLSLPGPQRVILPYFVKILIGGVEIIQSFKETSNIEEIIQHQRRVQHYYSGSSLEFRINIKSELEQEWVSSALK